MMTSVAKNFHLSGLFPWNLANLTENNFFTLLFLQTHRIEKKLRVTQQNV